MAAEERWYFTKEELNNSPSRRCGIDAEKELSYRQQGANLIQDMGQRLQVNQLAINTAIVYMHRFYMFHPFTRFHRNSIAPAALFLAAKVEEQPRKLEHVIKVAYHCLFRDQPALDTQSEGYLERAQELVVNENILLQTLGFDVAIDHPHTHVVKCCQLVRATKDLAQTSYFMATSSLHMTTMCLQYKPTVVACVCIYIVCTWSHYEIQRVTEGKDWFWYVDKTVTLELLETLTAEFLAILDKCPNRLKKIMNSSQHTEDRGKGCQPGSSATVPSSRSLAAVGSSSSSIASRGHDHNSHSKTGLKVPPSQPHQHQQPPKLNLKEYNEKREKERKEREKMRDRDGIDPRDSKQFTLVSTSHSSQAVTSTVASIASSHAALHSSLPMRVKSGKSSSGRSTHVEHVKASAVHSSNHKTHGHGASQATRDSQPALESLSLRVSAEAPRQEQRRDVSARSDSERYDKGNRTSSSNVDGRLPGVDVKPSVSDIRQQQLLDVKPSRQSLDASLLERKKEIKLEQKTTERKPPEPKQEQVKIKTEIKTEPKEEVKSQYNTIFNNSDLPEFALSDFLNENTFLNLSDGPPDELFDNSDTETKPNIAAILEDNSLLPSSTHQKNKSPVSCQQQVGHQAQHTQHTSSGHAAAVTSGTSGNGDQRVSESAGATAAHNYHGTRHHHTATNGSVPAPQPAQITPQSSKSSSSRKSRDGERRNSERGEAELVPMVTKLEDTRYRTALSDPGTPIKVRPDAANAAAANSTSKPPAPSYNTPTAVNAEPAQKIPSELVLRVKVPQPELQKELQAEPPPVVGSASIPVVPENKKHKYDHPHHKHKEKKKHKHKEKDKHKDREHKEHKEHKKEKKHKKRKDREKDKEKARSSGDGGIGPIKITIAKDKIVNTPEPTLPLRPHTTAPPAAVTVPTPTPNTTPVIPKFKITKSKLSKKDLFGGTSSTSPESSPAGDLTRDTPTTSLKIKISRDRLRPDKESKKRDRDRSPGDVHPAKIPRNGSEARPTHAAPQVPIKDLDPSRWSSQRQ
ncbi:cyclin-T2-like isoform X1 [Homarus americanus]|uniref:cyclin-T2-like isoform X1 n=2 Tax=Homarus americanus TaxID=6706 RepID=UPI001C45690F|nr:cyclin-T2-like isoform X1 [Homarus americanus]